VRLSLTYFRKDQNHSIGNIKIILPGFHQLPRLKAKYPKYDQFLPFLAKEFGDGTIVVDIGANCGDTLTSIAIANPRLRQIVVEPDNDFLRYLYVNINSLQNRYPDLDVSVFPKAILRSNKAFRLVGSKGTKSMIFDPNSEIIPSQTLDELLAEVDPTNVSLIKVDVDGFDYEVLLSGVNSLAKLQEAVIFFEMDVSNLEQINGYLELHSELGKIGFSEWYLFDNFGNYLQKSNSYSQIFSLRKYSLRQKKRSQPSIYYFDILVCRPNQVKKVESIIESYESLNG
jgi:FkbM family methyltransferase